MHLSMSSVDPSNLKSVCFGDDDEYIEHICVYGGDSFLTVISCNDNIFENLIVQQQTFHNEFYFTVITLSNAVNILNISEK